MTMENKQRQQDGLKEKQGDGVEKYMKDNREGEIGELQIKDYLVIIGAV